MKRLYPYLENSPVRSLKYAETFFKANTGGYAAQYYSHIPRWSTTEKNSILGLFAQDTINTAHQIKPLFIRYTDFNHLDSTLKKEIKDHGIIIFEKGSPWEAIHQELRRYKSITL